MSVIPENDTPQNAGPSWDPTGALTDVPELVESEISRASFYQDVFRPAWKAMEDAAATLLLEWFSGGISTIGQLVNWYNTRQAEKEIRHYQQRPAYGSKKGTVSVPLSEPIGLRKITGHQGKNGNLGDFPVENTTTQTASAAKTLNKISKTNPWLEATKKQQCVLDIKPPQAPPSKWEFKSARKPLKSTAKAVKMTVIDETNLGLDDIYTSPVNGLFTEEKDFSGKKPQSAKGKASHKQASPKNTALPKLSSHTLAALIDAELDQVLPQKRNAARKAASPESIQHRVDGFFNWAELQTAQSEIAAPKREPQEYEFIPGLSPSPSLEALEYQNPENEEPQVAQEILNQQFIEEEESEIIVSSTQALNRNGASILLAKAKSASLEFKRHMPVYQEMKTELSGADHMARNNRILHNSISNLADAYFKKAAEEEQSGLY